MDIYRTSQETLRRILDTGAEVSVIGGWAIWAYNPYKYSLDIDLVIEPKDVWIIRERLLEDGFNETSGGHLDKKVFKKAFEGGTIEVDVYDDRIGPFRATEVLRRSVERELFGKRTRVASPTDIFMLKLHALLDRRDSGKGQKDVSDLIALLVAVGGEIDLDTVRETMPRKMLRGAVALLRSSYQQISKAYPISMAEYKRLKSMLERLVD